MRDGIEPRFDKAMLPASSTTQRIGGGTLVVVGDNPAAPPLRDVLAVRRAMGYTVPGAEPEQGDIAGAPVTAATGSVPGAGLQKPRITPPRPATGEAEHGSAIAGHQDSTP